MSDRDEEITDAERAPRTRTGIVLGLALAIILLQAYDIPIVSAPVRFVGTTILSGVTKTVRGIFWPPPSVAAPEQPLAAMPTLQAEQLNVLRKVETRLRPFILERSFDYAKLQAEADRQMASAPNFPFDKKPLSEHEPAIRYAVVLHWIGVFGSTPEDWRVGYDTFTSIYRRHEAERTGQDFRGGVDAALIARLQRL